MSKFIILTDSSCDLDKEIRDKYQIEYVPMHFSIDGKDYDADLDWKTISVKDFYDTMRKGTRIFTAQVNAEEYKIVFEKYLSEGYDILSISCSSGLSASVKASYVARDEMLEKYPDRKIICIDSLISCAGVGILTIRASELRQEGKSIEEVAAWVEENKLNIRQEGTVDKLSFLKQAGRISAAAAFFGGLLSVKPIVISDVKGRNVSVEKVKGRKESIKRIAERVAERYLPVDYKGIFILHADCYEDAQLLKAEIMAKVDISEEDIHFGYIGPIIGASCGPGMMGVYFYGDKETYDLDKVNG